MSRSSVTDLAVGAEIPELAVEIDAVHLFMFSAITWNRHLIHYDQEQARREGHTSIVAQRSLLGNYFARQVTSWLDGQGRLTRLSWKVVRSTVPGDKLTCRGRIAEIDGPAIGLALAMSVDDEVVASGTATVELGPGR